MKLNMFKSLVLASVVTVSGAVFTASAAERMHVVVPFSFTVAGIKMPAGDYNVSQTENGMVILTGAKTSAMVLTVPADFSKHNQTALGFTAAETPALTSIQVSGSISREIPLHGASDRKTTLANAR